MAKGGTRPETPAETENKRQPTVRHNSSKLGSAARYCMAEQQLLHASHALATRLDLVYFHLKSPKNTFWALAPKPHVLAKKCSRQKLIT